MATIRVKGVQMVVGQKKADNLPRILDYIRDSDCDFIIFPEMALTGHNDGFSDAKTLDAWEQISAACRQAYVTALVGTGSRADGIVYIQSRIFDDHGEVLGTQEKLVPTDTDRKWCRPGSKLKTFEHKNVMFGCLIANDLWVAPGKGPYPDPRLSCQLGQRGARVIFHLNASGTDPLYAQYYDANLRLRAIEAKCPIVTVNAASTNGPLNIASGIVNPEGEWLVSCPAKGEHVFSYDLEVDEAA